MAVTGSGTAAELIKKIATDQQFREQLTSASGAAAKQILSDAGFGDVTPDQVRDASFDAVNEVTDDQLFTQVAANAADDTITTTTTTTTVFAAASAAVAAAI
ncbi:MAG: hypothetical protein ABR613_08265 [Actinomycetota bacterium]